MKGQKMKHRKRQRTRETHKHEGSQEMHRCAQTHMEEEV